MDGSRSVEEVGETIAAAALELHGSNVGNDKTCQYQNHELTIGLETRPPCFSLENAFLPEGVWINRDSWRPADLKSARDIMQWSVQPVDTTTSVLQAKFYFRAGALQMETRRSENSQLILKLMIDADQADGTGVTLHGTDGIDYTIIVTFEGVFPFDVLLQVRNEKDNTFMATNDKSSTVVDTVEASNVDTSQVFELYDRVSVQFETATLGLNASSGGSSCYTEVRPFAMAAHLSGTVAGSAIQEFTTPKTNITHNSVLFDFRISPATILPEGSFHVEFRSLSSDLEQVDYDQSILSLTLIKLQSVGNAGDDEDASLHAPVTLSAPFRRSNMSKATGDKGLLEADFDAHALDPGVYQITPNAAGSNNLLGADGLQLLGTQTITVDNCFGRGCVINGVCVQEDEHEVGDDCHVCLPTLSLSAWSKMPETAFPNLNPFGPWSPTIKDENHAAEGYQFRTRDISSLTASGANCPKSYEERTSSCNPYQSAINGIRGIFMYNTKCTNGKRGLNMSSCVIDCPVECICNAGTVYGSLATARCKFQSGLFQRLNESAHFISVEIISIDNVSLVADLVKGSIDMILINRNAIPSYATTFDRRKSEALARELYSASSLSKEDLDYKQCPAIALGIDAPAPIFKCDHENAESIDGVGVCTQSSRLVCPPGEFGLLDGPGCAKAPAGGFFIGEGQGRLGFAGLEYCNVDHCPNGTFSPVPGGTSCSHICPAGTDTSVHAGYKGCPCLKDHYRTDRMGPCFPCSGIEGLVCTQDTFAAKEGWYLPWHPDIYPNVVEYITNMHLEASHDRSITRIRLRRATSVNASEDGENATSVNASEDARISRRTRADSTATTTADNATADTAPPQSDLNASGTFELPRPIKCVYQGNCQETPTSQCADGCEGPLCAVCSATYFALLGSCIKCPEREDHAWKTLTFFLVATITGSGFLFVRYLLTSELTNVTRVARLTDGGTPIDARATGDERKWQDELKRYAQIRLVNPVPSFWIQTKYYMSGLRDVMVQFDTVTMLKIAIRVTQCLISIPYTFTQVAWPKTFTTFSSASVWASDSPMKIWAPDCTIGRPGAYGDFWIMVLVLPSLITLAIFSYGGTRLLFAPLGFSVNLGKAAQTFWRDPLQNYNDTVRVVSTSNDDTGVTSSVGAGVVKIDGLTHSTIKNHANICDVAVEYTSSIKADTASPGTFRKMCTHDGCSGIDEYVEKTAICTLNGTTPAIPSEDIRFHRILTVIMNKQNVGHIKVFSSSNPSNVYYVAKAVANDTVLVISSSTNDKKGGTGAQAVKIVGLVRSGNGSGKVQYTEQVTTCMLNGSTPAVPTDDISFYRIISVTANKKNHGNITVFGNNDSRVFDTIPAGHTVSNSTTTSVIADPRGGFPYEWGRDLWKNLRLAPQDTSFENDLKDRCWNLWGLWGDTDADDDVKSSAETSSMTRHLRVTRLTFAIFCFFLCYTSIAMACVNLLQPCHEICFEVDGTGQQDCKKFLRADYSIQCGTPTHHVHFVVAMFFLLLYNLAIPVWFIYTLHTHKETLRSVQELCDEQKHTVGNDERTNLPNHGQQLCWSSSWSRDVALAWRSMYRNYRRIGHSLGESQVCYLWDNIGMLQSFFFVAILRLLVPGTFWQLIWGLIFIQVVLYVECTVSPYRDQVCNFVSRMGHVVLSTCLLVGMVVWATEHDYFNADLKLDGTKFAAPLLLFAIISFYVAIATLLVAKYLVGGMAGVPVQAQAQQRGPSDYDGPWSAAAASGPQPLQLMQANQRWQPQTAPPPPHQQQTIGWSHGTSHFYPANGTKGNSISDPTPTTAPPIPRTRSLSFHKNKHGSTNQNDQPVPREASGTSTDSIHVDMAGNGANNAMDSAGSSFVQVTNPLYESDDDDESESSLPSEFGNADE